MELREAVADAARERHIVEPQRDAAFIVQLDELVIVAVEARRRCRGDRVVVELVDDQVVEGLRRVEAILRQRAPRAAVQHSGLHRRHLADRDSGRGAPVHRGRRDRPELNAWVGAVGGVVDRSGTVVCCVREVEREVCRHCAAQPRKARRREGAGRVDQVLEEAVGQHCRNSGLVVMRRNTCTGASAGPTVSCARVLFSATSPRPVRRR
jgi:hypothetical protein